MKKLLLPILFYLPLFHSPIARAELTVGTPAPEFPPNTLFLGSGGKPLSMSALRGKVVLVDFWEYTCINCIRTFPHLKDWYAKYHDDGLAIVGVHKGEFAIAEDPKNVTNAYARFALPYPSAVDVGDRIWRAYDSNSWPNSFLIDRKGVIREVHGGEGNYGKFEAEIRKLLLEGHPEIKLPKAAGAPDKPLFGGPCGSTTDEIYVGHQRGSKWGGRIANAEGFQPDKTVDYARTKTRVERGFFVEGPWKNGADGFESAVSSGNSGNSGNSEKRQSLGITYHARDVYAVLDRAAKAPVELTITRDGKPIPAAQRGRDVKGGAGGQTVITIDEPRMYYLVTHEDEKPHELVLSPLAPGARIDSFTFGNKCLETFDRL